MVGEKQDRKYSECTHHSENDIPERPDLVYMLVCKARHTYVTDEFAKKCFRYEPSMGVTALK